jgi:tetratricopeptide (TPR) repeat protein
LNEVQKFDALKKNIEEDPMNFQARRELVMLCLDQGLDEMALKHLNYLTEFFPEDANLHFNMGVAWEKIRQPECALKAYEAAVMLKPEEPDFLYNLALVAESLGELDRAMLTFKQAACLDCNDANTFFNIGYLYVAKNDPENAIKCFKRSLLLNPEDFFAYFYLGQEYKKIGEVDLAISAYNKVLELSHDYSWAYFNLGQIYWERNDVERALEMLNLTLSKNPKDIEAHKLMLKILLQDGDARAAWQMAHEGLEKFEEAAGDFHYYIAKSCEALGESVNRLEHLKSALINQKTLKFDAGALKAELSALEEEMKDAGGDRV